jgi:Protein of unknown function (DUF4038)/Domain of unknown function (DUF5060)/Putative collagen-binding domain of a collagenase
LTLGNQRRQVSVLYRSFALALIATSILLTGVPVLAQNTMEIPVKQWGVFEKVLRSTARYSNEEKYKDITLYATFNGPRGLSYTVPGFWDGGDTWRVRFSPTVPGEWSYMISSSDDQLDDSTHDGTFTAVAPSAADIATNPNDRGFLKISSDNRYLTYADGTPFFWMGGTIWDGNSKNMAYETDFKVYIDNRKLKGFSVIQLLVGRPATHYSRTRYTGWNENGPVFHRPGNMTERFRKFANKGLRIFGSEPIDYRFREINPENLQNLDLRISYIIDKGMVPFLHFVWDRDYKQMDTNSLKNLAKYLIARYQAYNIIWSIGGEHYFVNDKIKYREVGNYVHHIDTLGHLTTVHGWTGDFVGEAWIDFVSETSWELPTAMHDKMVNELYSRKLPFVMVESRYEGNEPDDNYTVLKYAWESLTSGALGYTCGVEEIRAWDHEWDKNQQRFIRYVPGLSRERLDTPTSFYMKYIVEFFADKEWWKLIPHNAIVNRGRCLAEVGRQYVIWLNGGGSVTVDLSEAPDELGMYWFNPLTGEKSEMETMTGGTSHSFTPPFHGDAVLFIKAIGG